MWLTNAKTALSTMPGAVHESEGLGQAREGVGDQHQEVRPTPATRSLLIVSLLSLVFIYCF
jgi:hypothetical protein